MATYTKQELSDIKKDKENLLKLILKKTGMTYNRFLELAKQEFIVSNLDVVTSDEKKQFRNIVL